MLGRNRHLTRALLVICIVAWTRIGSAQDPTVTSPSPPLPASYTDRFPIDWTFHLVLMGASDPGAGSGVNGGDPPNDIDFQQVRAEVIPMFRLTNRSYIGFGVTASYVGAEGSRCSTELSCQGSECACNGATAKWSGTGFAYGATLGYVFKASIKDNPFSLVWLPVLTLSHVMYGMETASAGCEDVQGEGNCSDPAPATLAAELAIGADFAHTAFGGCGLRIGMTYLVGDLAEMHDNPLLLHLAFQFNFNLIDG